MKWTNGLSRPVKIYGLMLAMLAACTLLGITLVGAVALACAPGGVWGCAVVRDTTIAAIDAGYLAAARQAARRDGTLPAWLTTLTANTWLDQHLAALEHRCIVAGIDAAEFEQ